MPVNGKLSNSIRLVLFSTALASFSAGAIAQESGTTTPVQALSADPLMLEGDATHGAEAPAARESASREEELPRGRREPIGEETAAAARQPTEITASKETSFDEKARKVVFIGDVIVKDPEFHLTCERLTVFLKKGGAPAANSAKNNPNNANDNNANGDAAAAPGEGGLERVIAEGKVVILQEKPDEKGKVTRYVGKASKAEYNSMTGDVTLSGWPQIQQGINNQVATEEGTIMILNRNGRMQTVGASKTVIAESSEAPRHTGRPGPKRPTPNGTQGTQSIPSLR